MIVRNIKISPAMGTCMSRFSKRGGYNYEHIFFASDGNIFIDVECEAVCEKALSSNIKESNRVIFELRDTMKVKTLDDMAVTKWVTLASGESKKVKVRFELSPSIDLMLSDLELVMTVDGKEAKPFGKLLICETSLTTMLEIFRPEGVGVNFGDPLFTEDWDQFDFKKMVPSSCTKSYPNAQIEIFMHIDKNLYLDNRLYLYWPIRLRLIEPNGKEKSCYCFACPINDDLSKETVAVSVSTPEGFFDVSKRNGAYLVVSLFSKVLAVVSCDSFGVPGEVVSADAIMHELPVSLARVMKPNTDEVSSLATGKASADERLEAMIGLASVKMAVKKFLALKELSRIRQNLNMCNATGALHAVFYGNPGTGKTTVAKLLGEILHDKGVLSSGHVVMAERATLMGEYYGTVEKNTRAVLDKAQGGILFIDEAYQLYNPKDPRDPGREVVQSLMTALADTEMRDWMLILAGYTKDMQDFFNINPGLESRIPCENRYFFEDYSPDELMEIALSYLADYDYRLSDEAAVKLRARVDYDYGMRDKSFGNARYVLNMIETEIIPSVALRNYGKEDLTYDDLQVILPGDVPDVPECQPNQPKRVGFSM